MVRKYFLNSVSEAAVNNMFWQSIPYRYHSIEKMISSHIKSKSIFFKFESMSSGQNMIIIISIMIR